jgi:phosphoribosylformylglycinamidine (FGAM) synthase PurS component
MRWEKEGKEVREALVGDEVDLVCEVKDINNGEKVKLTVWEHDEDNEHDHVADLTGVVENGKVAIKWKVVYTEDNDDSTSGKEMAEKGYTLPEYHFVAEYDGVENEESSILLVYGWGNTLLSDKNIGEPIKNRDFVLLTPEGEYISGTTGSDGLAKVDKVKFGKYILIT